MEFAEKTTACPATRYYVRLKEQSGPQGLADTAGEYGPEAAERLLAYRDTGFDAAD